MVCAGPSEQVDWGGDGSKSRRGHAEDSDLHGLSMACARKLRCTVPVGSLGIASSTPRVEIFSPPRLIISSDSPSEAQEAVRRELTQVGGPEPAIAKVGGVCFLVVDVAGGSCEDAEGGVISARFRWLITRDRVRSRSAGQAFSSRGRE